LKQKAAAREAKATASGIIATKRGKKSKPANTTKTKRAKLG
jgi:hypothetical protein